MFSIVIIAPVWLLLWEKGQEEAAERKKEGKRENGGGSGQSWIRILRTSASYVSESSLMTWRGFFPKQKGLVPKNLTPPPSRKTHVFVSVVERGRRSGLCLRWQQTGPVDGFSPGTVGLHVDKGRGGWRPRCGVKKTMGQTSANQTPFNTLKF